MAPCYGWRSPHTRGAHQSPTKCKRTRRIIPAYAGSTHQTARPPAGSTDHPRIRGEHGWPRHHIQPHPGSSPHTRGAPARNRPDPTGCGIIPAYAGSTGFRGCRPTRARDHPRIRGEHFMNVRNAAPSPGSSPHTRGAHERHVVIYECGRIIPAYAGSTQRAPDLHGPGPGSSPHTRGAHPRPHPIRHPARIIPAYAGSTGTAPSDPPSKADHPRIRGEHPLAMKTNLLPMGSSPHTRGAREHAAGVEGPGGIIPAYAGSTPSPRSSKARCWDHPRIRGEHASGCRESSDDRGSSPHTRGALTAFDVSVDLAGIIPAYAGSTPPRTMSRP